MTETRPDFNLRAFIDSRFDHTRTADNLHDTTIAVDPATASDDDRVNIARLIEGVDNTSIQVLLPKAVVAYPNHIGQLVATLCKTFERQQLVWTDGYPWDSSQPLSNVRGNMLEAIAELHMKTTRSLLLDASLTYWLVAWSLSGVLRFQSEALHRALLDIKTCEQKCLALVVKLPINNAGTDFDDFAIDPSSHTDIESTPKPADQLKMALVKLAGIEKRTPMWETRRDTLESFQEITTRLAERVADDQTFRWGTIMVHWLIAIADSMTDKERERYRDEGFYQGLVDLSYFLPSTLSTHIYELFNFERNRGSASSRDQHRIQGSSTSFTSCKNNDAGLASVRQERHRSRVPSPTNFETVDSREVEEREIEKRESRKRRNKKGNERKKRKKLRRQQQGAILAIQQQQPQREPEPLQTPDIEYYDHSQPLLLSPTPANYWFNAGSVKAETMSVA